jgi:two-component system NtrC family sensor kinase
MRELKFKFSGALLMILTVAAAVSAFINFQQQTRFKLPDDGVTWVDRNGSVRAFHVTDGSPADRVGVRRGDILVKIAGAPIQKAIEVSQVLVGIGAWNKATYVLRRDGVEFEAPLIVGTALRNYAALYWQYLVGLVYLGVGLFVFFRRGNAPRSLHFYTLCLASFIMSAFHFTGKLNSFDKAMYYGNVLAGLFAPTIFLHFCLAFPEKRGWFRRRGRILVVYVPAVIVTAVLLGVSSGVLRMAVDPIELNWLLDRVCVVFLTATYLFGGWVLHRAYRRVQDPVVRQQIKWLRNGALLGAVPFAAVYAIPYGLLGVIPSTYMDAAVLSFVLIPITWAYAIVRYRLMDVDIIFQQGYVYTLATICVLAVFYGLIFWVGGLEDIGATAAGVLILIAAFVFQPIRKWIQEMLDRYVFYKDKYDYRLTLIEFARELSSEIDPDALMRLAADRLKRTLSIERVTFFLCDEEGRFRLRDAEAGRYDRRHYDLSFLAPEPDRPYLFFEQTRHLLDVVSKTWPASVRDTISELDLTYYLPCLVRGRTIAYLGVSRTEGGDFLTSEDLELLVTVSGYIGIAIENARLYRSLARKMEEYERLKEYSENIVESINVGILAADLEDRVESWNSRMEQLTGIARDAAVGRLLPELLPAELVAQFGSAQGANGIHHIYRFTLRPKSEGNVIEMPVGGSNGRQGAAATAAQPEPQPQRETILNIAVAPLISKDLEQIGRIVIFDDVTERDELERRLVQADKLSSVGLLAAGVAHEVNTPLAVISTYAQMLAKQVSGDDQKSKLLEKIAKQTFRASEIVNSLLNFSRTSPSAFDELAVNRVVQESLTLIQHQMEKAGIRVQLELEEQLPTIRGNSGKLQQVFLNLFLNARDAMGTGGTLTVRTYRQAEGVGIDVTDTGHGIQPENLSRIFDPFFTTKAIRKGTGLGLSVTYGIVREHSGVIEVESQPGEGTRFHLEFPAARKAVHA